MTRSLEAGGSSGDQPKNLLDRHEGSHANPLVRLSVGLGHEAGDPSRTFGTFVAKLLRDGCKPATERLFVPKRPERRRNGSRAAATVSAERVDIVGVLLNVALADRDAFQRETADE